MRVRNHLSLMFSVPGLENRGICCILPLHITLDPDIRSGNGNDRRDRRFYLIFNRAVFDGPVFRIKLFPAHQSHRRLQIAGNRP